MQIRILLLLTFLILVFLNYAIYQKEDILKSGELMLLEVEPFDPRSLMQGDYMQFTYTITRLVREMKIDIPKSSKYLVILLDQNKVGTFQRFYKGEVLAEQERKLRFHEHFNDIYISPNSFFFQEGHAKFYQDAKYAVFKVDTKGNYILVGMANKDYKLVEPTDDPNVKSK